MSVFLVCMAIEKVLLTDRMPLQTLEYKVSLFCQIYSWNDIIWWWNNVKYLTCCKEYKRSSGYCNARKGRAASLGGGGEGRDARGAGGDWRVLPVQREEDKTRAVKADYGVAANDAKDCASSVVETSSTSNDEIICISSNVEMWEIYTLVNIFLVCMIFKL
jgi:hypothetical protein